MCRPYAQSLANAGPRRTTQPRDKTYASVPVVLDQTTANDALISGKAAANISPSATPTIARSIFLVAGLLKDSIFQGDLLLGEDDLHSYDPAAAGYRYFLIETPPGQATTVQQALQQKLGDYGFASETTAERLGGLGRRAEHVSGHVPDSAGWDCCWAPSGWPSCNGGTFGAAGRIGPAPCRRFPRAMLAILVAMENMLLLLLGLGIGLAAARWPSCRTSPAAARPCPTGYWPCIFSLVLVAGLGASLGAVRGVLRTPILPALREEK